jgi:uncharacterized repeat protein (TIGR01451 family)
MHSTLKILTSMTSASVMLISPVLLLASPVRAQTAISNDGCPVGTREGIGNFVRNPNFTNNAGTGPGVRTPANPPPFAPFPAGIDVINDPDGLPYRGDAVYPDDTGGGGLSIQNDQFPIAGVPSAIVAGRGVRSDEAAQAGIGPTAIPTYLYSNPNLRQSGASSFVGVPPVIWGQNISGLSGNTVYNFKALFYNLLLPGAPGVPPQIRLQVATFGSTLATPQIIQTSTAIVVGEGAPIPGFSGIPNVRQAWIPVQFSFRTLPGQTSLQLRIVDEAQNIIGDDFGVTAIGLRECIPNIGVAKRAGTPSQNADGSFTIPYSIVVRNLAPAGVPDPYVLNNLQLAEDLGVTFAGTTIVSVGNLQSPTLVVNPNFNGTNNTLLLQPNVNSLPAGDSATVNFSVTILPTTNPGPYTNTVLATATSNSGTNVIDRSTDGAVPDPDGDGNAGNNESPTVVALPGLANIVLVKRITNITRNGVPLAGVNFATFVDDPNTTDDNNSGWAQLLPQGAPTGVLTLSNNVLARAGDEVEYTVYFLSNGAIPALAANICDPIPPGTTFIPTTAQLQIGTNLPGSSGTFFSPLAPLPANNSCADQRNPNGALIFNLGDVVNTPTDNVGLVRFRVQIN